MLRQFVKCRSKLRVENYVKRTFELNGPFVRASGTKALVSDDDLVDLFQPDPLLAAENEIILREEPSKLEKRKTPNRPVADSRDLVIRSKRPEFNHYKNQRYDKLSPIPLVSKGWYHAKSKGDYFQIRISNENEYIENLFWDSEVSSFSKLGLSDKLVEALDLIGISRPTRIQASGIPVILKGKNTLLTAETGCGKTLSFLLPAVEQCLKWSRLKPNRPPNTPLVLIITPSRELAQQIGAVAKSLSRLLPFSCSILVGGRTKQRMLNPDFRHVDLLVASLGALSKLTTTGIYQTSEVKHIIMDEADTLLDDSFSDLLLRYLKKIKVRYQPESKEGIPEGTQLTLVSATMPNSVYTVLENIVQPDSLTNVTSGRLHKVLPHVLQTFYRLGPIQKPAKLLYLVKESVAKKKPVIIFSNKSKTCDWVSMMLNENGVNAVQLNGEMPRIIRLGKFREFQSGALNVLSCTDIASRGLDTVRVKNIINYDFPLYMADYLHRCGRTGRVGSDTDCEIHNFVCGAREIDLVQKIELAVRTMEVLPNVNGNITKIIHRKVEKEMKELMGQLPLTK